MTKKSIAEQAVDNVLLLPTAEDRVSFGIQVAKEALRLFAKEIERIMNHVYEDNRERDVPALSQFDDMYSQLKKQEGIK